MDITALIALILQYGPGLVKDIVDLINGNPRIQNETDEDYIARLKAMTEKNLQDALDQNKTVEEG